MDRSLSLIVKFAALDKLTAPLRKLSGGAKVTARDMAAARKEVLGLERSVSKVGAYQDLQREVTQTHEALDVARRRVTALKAAIAQTDGPTGRLAQQLGTAERKVERLSDAAQKQAGRLGMLGSELREAGINTNRLGDEQGRLAADLDRVNKRLKEQRDIADRASAARARGDKMRDLGGRMIGGGAALGAAGAATLAPLALGVKTAIDFDEAMADVRKVVNGTPADLEKLRKGILAVSRTMPVKPEGIASIIAAGAQAGIARGELVPFASDAAKMAVAFDITADEAGQAMAKWRSAFGIGQAGVRTLSDQINLLGNVSGAKADAIARIVTRIGPLGSVAGLASAEIAALGATLGGMGVEEEIAATGIKNAMLALTQGAAATKAQKGVFRQLGLEAEGVSKSMQVNAKGTIIDVLQRLSRMPKAVQSGLLNELFGSESIAAIAPLMTQLGALQKNFKRVGDAQLYQNAVQAEYDSRAGTTAQKLLILSNRVDVMKIALGDRLLPVVEAGAAKFGAIADRITAFAEAHPALTKAALMTAGAIGIAMAVIGSLAVIIGTTLGPIAILATALSTPWAAATLFQRGLLLLAGPLRIVGFLVTMLGRALLLNPWGLAIAGTIALAYAIYTHWGKIKAFLAGLVPFFRQIGGQMMNGLLSMLSPARLVANVVRMGKAAIGAFKSVLGIHSPSRVFAGLGDHMMTGLALGLDRGVRRPLARVRAAGVGMTRAMAASTAVVVPPGLDRGVSPPLARIRAAGVDMTRATAVGTAAVVPLAARGAPASAGLSSAVAQPPGTAPARPITIQILQQPGESADALADRVVRKLRDAERSQRTSSYEDLD